MNLILTMIYLISANSSLDIYFTNLISIIPTYKFSKFYSKYIIYFNIFANLYYLFTTFDFLNLFIRYFIELIIINCCFKLFLDRPRPCESIFKEKKLLNTKKYVPVYGIKFTKKFLYYQSFPSGHVGTIYGTFLLFNNKFYFYLILITIYCRVNIKMHHFSDCLYAILITDVSWFLINNYILI